MKKILLLALIVTLIKPGLFGQQNCNNIFCIQNPGLDGSGVGRGNPINNTMPSWWVISGTPTLERGVVNSNGFRLTNGDGFATCYNFFQNTQYRICLMAYTTNGQDGIIRLEANDGAGGSQQIGSILVTQQGLEPAPYDVVFTTNPGFNFNQLRILVDTPTTSVVIDDVGVIEIPTVTVNPSPKTWCSNATITVSGNTVNNMNINWAPATFLNQNWGQQVIASNCATEIYTMTYSSTCNPMFSCNNNAIQVTVPVDPPTNITNNSSFICGEQIDLEYIPNQPCPGATYAWRGPRNNTVLSTTSQLFIPNASAPDVGAYVLTITLPNGCSTTVTEMVDMNCCDVVADFDPVDCNPIRFINTTSTTNLSGVQGEWHWDFGDGNTSSIKNPSNLYTTQLGPHTVCLTAVLSNGLSTCCAKICKEVEVCDFTCEPKAAFGYKVLDATTGDVQFTDKSVGGGTACGWQWWVNGVPNPVSYSGQTPTINFGGPGIYNVCLEVEFCCLNGTSHYETWCEDIIVQ